MAQSKIMTDIAHHSQIKMRSTKSKGMGRGGANHSMYSHNKTASMQGSAVSEGRYKGSRGGSEDVMVRVRGKHGMYRTQKGDVNQTMIEDRETEIRKRELKKANDRLKVIERLEKYREEKMKKQYE